MDMRWRERVHCWIAWDGRERVIALFDRYMTVIGGCTVESETHRGCYGTVLVMLLHMVMVLACVAFVPKIHTPAYYTHRQYICGGGGHQKPRQKIF